MKNCNLLGLVCFITVLSFYSTNAVIQNVDGYSFIPKNFIEAISLIHDKNTLSKNLHQNKIDFFYNDNGLKLYSHMKNLLKTSNSLETLNAQFPNLTQACLIQVLGVSQAFSKKELWTIKSNLKKLCKIFESLFL
jgi:hypothetical protein